MIGRPKIRNMEEFATVSGLSRPTVSKYFNDPDSVRASTRDRIERALEEFDYRPNIYAMNQNRKLTKTVGIMVPYLADPVFAEIARNLESRCVAAGYSPTLFSSYGQQSVENDILENIRALKPAGALIAPLGRRSDLDAYAKFCSEIPTVLVDSRLNDLGLAFVGSDNDQFGDLMVDYLCRTGEPPCFLDMKTPANPNAIRRRKAYIDAMEAQGQSPCIVGVEGEGWGFEEIGRQGGGKALDDGVFATNTVLCSNDRLAIGFLTACYERNLTVGRHKNCAIRVAGQDDHPYSRFTCPPLTTIAHDYDAISRRAADILVGALEGAESEEKYIQFDGRLVMRDSA